MKSFIEIHVLQSFAPSVLNRDDTGAPKDCQYGGTRRARISSQSYKRAVREYVRDHGLVDQGSLATRTKLVVAELVRRLSEQGYKAEEAESVVEAALGGISLKCDEDHKTEYLLFIGKREVDRIAELLRKHWDTLSEVSKAEIGESTKTGKKAKKAAKRAVPAKVSAEIKKALDGGRAIDLALFGRMLADIPSQNITAAAQVAHAISTHTTEREFDFFTAVDDLKPDEEAGAGMLGTIEFNSACYYRYALLDLEKLVENLQHDWKLALLGTEAFLRSFALSVPSGKQSSFAAHNPPGFVAITVREETYPHSMTGAFERPVRAQRDTGLMTPSINRLDSYWDSVDSVYGGTGQPFIACVTVEKNSLSYLKSYTVPTFNDLISNAMQVISELPVMQEEG